MNPVKRYLDSHPEINQVELARRAGISPQSLSDFLSDRCSMSAQRKLDLVAATGGEVTVNDLVHWDAGRRERRTAASSDEGAVA